MATPIRRERNTMDIEASKMNSGSFEDFLVMDGSVSVYGIIISYLPEGNTVGGHERR